MPQSSRVFARETNTAGGTTNWRVQGGMQSAAMAAEGKAKTAKASRKVSQKAPVHELPVDLSVAASPALWLR